MKKAAVEWKRGYVVLYMKEKRKRCIICILSLTVVLLFFLMAKENNSGKRFNDYIVSEEKFDGILGMYDESKALLISELIFNESPLFFDDTNEVFYYSMQGSDFDVYNPVIKMIPQEAEVSIAIKEKEITNDLIRENDTIDLVIYTDKKYSVYKLKCTTLPIMNIDVGDEITEENVQMSMQLFDNREGVVQKVIESSGLIHVRGGSTKSYPKLGYKITLTDHLPNDRIRKNKCSLLGMRKDDDWILYAAYNDQEKIRNVFSSNLWMETCSMDNSFQIENGMRYEYVELFLNGQYWGLYALGYPIDDLQMNTKKNAGECIYKKVLWNSEYPIAYAEDGSIAGYRISSSGKEDWTILYDFYEKLNDTDIEDSWLYSSMDLENAVDYMLFINLIQGVDNVANNETKNMYLTAKLSGDGAYKYLYTPWDMDITWGNIWRTEADNLTVPYGLQASTHRLMESGPLYQLLMRNNEAAWEAYLGKYAELRAGKWSDEAIRVMLENFEHVIFDSGAYLRDMARWPDGSYENPELKLSAFTEYVLTRLHAMDEYYERVAEVQNENALIIRSVQYSNFKNSNFLIRIGDGYDEDVRELLEYIGISCQRIPEGCGFIFYNASSGEINYETDSSNVPFAYDWTEDDSMKVFFQQGAEDGYQYLWMGK